MTTHPSGPGKVHRSIPNPDPLYASMMMSFAPTEPASRAVPFGGGVLLSSTVRNALVNPTRADEIRGWAKKHPEMVRQWRGDDGETMMHWAFLSSWTLAADFADLGLSIQEPDRMGRTPMDWINDRLWQALVDPNTSNALSTGGQERLRRQSEELIVKLWAFGARPGGAVDSLPPGVVWIRAGAWDLLDLLNLYPWDPSAPQPTSIHDRQVVPVALFLPSATARPGAAAATDGPSSDSLSHSAQAPAPSAPQRPSDGWFNWTDVVGSALHAWVLAPDSHLKEAFLVEWRRRDLDVDQPDRDGRTPLWYAVDAWLSHDDRSWRRTLEQACRLLVRAGADPDADDAEGWSPARLLSARSLPNDSAAQLLRRVLFPVARS